MKIFVAGISTETNTFSPLPTSLEDFNVQRGRDVRADRIDHPSLDLSATWGQWARESGHECVFSLMAFAMPAGLTIQSAYEVLRDELLADLEAAMSVDIVLLNLHGAMVAHGYDDCEEDLIRRVREIVGPRAVIGVELDLHCHLSESKIAAADIVVTYKEYPHTDVHERARELFDLAVRTRLGTVRPAMALFDCRMVGMYPTSRQPLRGFVEAMKLAERRPGVLSISLGHGFQFADLPHVGAKILVISDHDPTLARHLARELGLQVHALRRRIGFDSLSLCMDEALSQALASRSTPVVVADQSDNTGGGAPGDSTFALRWLLDRRASEIAIAMVYDPEVVRIARKAGVGATLPMRLGGKLGPASGDPVDILATVLAVRDDYRHAIPQDSGDPWWFRAGDIVALHSAGIDIVVSSERCQCFSPRVFTDLGIDPGRKRVLVTKSYQHFFAGFAPIARKVIYMAAPGAVAPDPRMIPYRRLETKHLYPWHDNPLAN